MEHCLEGFHASIFAYGQTSSGKTHTMTGKLGNSGQVQAQLLSRSHGWGNAPHLPCHRPASRWQGHCAWMWHPPPALEPRRLSRAVDTAAELIFTLHACRHTAFWLALTEEHAAKACSLRTCVGTAGGLGHARHSEAVPAHCCIRRPAAGKPFHSEQNAPEQCSCSLYYVSTVKLWVSTEEDAAGLHPHFKHQKHTL